MVRRSQHPAWLRAGRSELVTAGRASLCSLGSPTLGQAGLGALTLQRQESDRARGSVQGLVRPRLRNGFIISA